MATGRHLKNGYDLITLRNDTPKTKIGSKSKLRDVRQSCPWVQFLQLNPTEPSKRLTQPSTTHHKVKAVTHKPTQPTTHNPIELHTTNLRAQGRQF